MQCDGFVLCLTVFDGLSVLAFGFAFASWTLTLSASPFAVRLFVLACDGLSTLAFGLRLHRGL